MKKNELEKSIEEGLSQRQIAQRFDIGQSTVRYYLQKYDLRTKLPLYNKNVVSEQICVICGKRIDSRRRKCGMCNTKIRRYRTKKSAVFFMGGKCNDCGWSGNISGFEFHHIRGVKEFEIGKVANKSWSAIKKELKKCELLCARCHRIKHSKYEDDVFLEEVEKYNGSILKW